MEAQTVQTDQKTYYKQELKRSLSFWDLLIYGMIFMVPIAPFGIYGSVAIGSNGMVALTYLIGMIGMIFTAVSYAQMSEAFPIAGSVYSYAQRGINDSVGFIAGWLILLDYVFVPALLYLVSASALHDLVPQVPIVLWAALFIGINTVINVLGIEFTAKANKIIVVLELIVLAIFLAVGIIAIVQGVNGATFTMKPLYDGDYFNMNLVMGAVSIAVLSFLGFDGISTLAEETKEGSKAIGKACIVALLTVGVMFIIQTWVAALIWPDFTTFENADVAFYQIAEVAGGTWLRILTILATALSWGIANALVAQAAISRILFSIARDGKFPKFLSKVHPKYKTPYLSTILIAVVSVFVVSFFSSQIGKLSSVVNFGALSSFLFLHISVINYFLRKKKSKNYLMHLVMPVIGFLIIGYVWINLDSLSKTLGFIWLAIGILYLIGLKLFKKDTSLNID
ncbi:APC family permease [Caldibacillus sp. 210928-DFI.2.22]|uniref:APC family permease n=1 Tax=unclassified Caldibacillus TaxID=2641266 RepID=UPI001D06CEA7|nr:MULTISPECIES: APC family permease [unclassified Caldibacillus]MCB7071540.1 APC family permease [Caldibacillus sp. 210928-DFI.2.22]MCB7074973.1 APC family permease [Caldibacillus sp. 210928-DFI.2.18]